ncbi:MAG: SDR family NAD(P)-dependent oxidoreductase [Bacteroidota bacterium]
MNQKPLHNLSAIVTGAGQGIGLEISKQLAQAGASVMLNDREESLAKTGAQEITKSHGICSHLAGDASEENCIQNLVDETVKLFGKVDIVVANAGITLFGDFLDYTRADFMRVMEVNLAGSFFLAQAATRQMIRQGTGGSILFMSSVTGHQAHKNLAAYGMSKAALEMLAKNLVIDLSPHQITINALAPGATATERTLNDPEYAKTWSQITPMGRPASVQDIAQAALFLVSPTARHITGQTLIVDGGWTSLSPSPY